MKSNVNVMESRGAVAWASSKCFALLVNAEIGMVFPLGF